MVKVTGTFEVKGMHCKSCIMLIEDSVSELKGVLSVKASLSKNKVIVNYDDSMVSENDISKAIESEGYKVE